MLAIIGDPVSHSLSPLMHNGWIADHGLDAVYVALPLRSGDPVGAIRALKHFGFTGVNVTVPHKEAAATAADRSDGAVANTLRWEKDGSLSAFNTDGPGFLDALNEAAPDWRAQREARADPRRRRRRCGHWRKRYRRYVDTVHFANRTAARAESGRRRRCAMAGRCAGTISSAASARRT